MLVQALGQPQGVCGGEQSGASAGPYSSWQWLCPADVTQEFTPVSAHSFREQGGVWALTVSAGGKRHADMQCDRHGHVSWLTTSKSSEDNKAGKGLGG